MKFDSNALTRSPKLFCRSSRRGWRGSISRRRQVRGWHSAPKLVEENSVHSAILSATDCRDWHIGLDQFLVLDIVGMLFLQCRPSDRRIHNKGGAFAGRIEHERVR
jgi:hypothetical protein